MTVMDLKIYWLQTKDYLKKVVQTFRDNTIEVSIAVVSVSVLIAYVTDDVNKATYALVGILLFAINDVKRSIVSKIGEVYEYPSRNEKMEVR